MLLLVWPQADDGLAEAGVAVEEVRPGQDDRRAKLAGADVERAQRQVLAVSVRGLAEARVLRVDAGRGEGVPLRDEPEAGDAVGVRDVLVEDQGQRSAEIAIEQVERGRLLNVWRENEAVAALLEIVAVFAVPPGQCPLAVEGRDLADLGAVAEPRLGRQGTVDRVVFLISRVFY